MFSSQTTNAEQESLLTGIYVNISDTGFDFPLIQEYELLVCISLNFQLPSVPILKQIENKASRQTEHVFSGISEYIYLQALESFRANVTAKKIN